MPPAAAGMKTSRCTFCRKKLDLGADISIHYHGVTGHRGPIPLENPQVFCSDACLCDHLIDPPEGPARIP